MPADLRCVCLLAVCSTSLGLVLTQREQHSQTPPLDIWETINSRRENFLHHNIRRYSSSWILDDGELPAFVTVQGDPRVHQKVKVKVTTPTQVHHLHLKKLESILHPDVKIVSITGHSNGKPDFIVEDIEPLVRERSQHFFHNPETGTVVSLWKHAAGHYLIEGHLDHATVIEPPGSRSRHTRDTDKKSHSVYRSVDGHEDIGSVGVVSPDQSSGSELVKSFASLLLKYELTPKSNGPATDKSISKEDQNRASLRERLKNVLERQSDFSAFPGSRHHEFLASDDDDHDDDFVEVPAVFENKSKWKVEKGRAERTSVDDGDKKPSKDQKMKHWPGLSTNIWAYEEARNRSHKFDRHHPRAKRQVATDWTSSLMPGYFEGDAGKTVVRKDGNYVVEVMTMVDARTYEDFNYDWMALQIYLLHFWQGVNARFQDIGDPKVRLKVKSINKVAFSGYQPFIENNRIDNSTGRVDVNGLLTEFMTYISNHYESNPALPDHDIAILLTGEDLCKKKADGTWSQKSKGIAFVRGGCISSRRFLNQSYDVGVVEVGRGFRGILTAAHEVGHLLGAFHDGEKNSSSCSSSSGHLMSQVWADPYLYNRFSNCSRQNFKHFMENTWYSECLLSSDSNYTTGYEFPPHWAGEVSSIEDQCHQYIEGIPCVGVSLESQCGQLCCEKWTQQFPSKEPAVDGTFCGVGKMCYDGECVTKRVGQ